MATQQDLKTAQKVMMASGVARSIFEVDVDRLAAALTLMTPSELERLDAVAHVAGMVKVDENGPVVPEPRQRQPRKPRAALGQGLARPANVKCLKPGCEFDAEMPESKFCRNHTEELRAS